MALLLVAEGQGRHDGQQEAEDQQVSGVQPGVALRAGDELLRAAEVAPGSAEDGPEPADAEADDQSGDEPAEGDMGGPIHSVSMPTRRVIVQVSAVNRAIRRWRRPGHLGP